MSSFDGCIISSSFYDSNNVSMNGYEFASSASAQSRKEGVQRSGIDSLFSTVSIFRKSFLMTPGFFPENEEISTPPPT